MGPNLYCAGPFTTFSAQQNVLNKKKSFPPLRSRIFRQKLSKNNLKIFAAQEPHYCFRHSAIIYSLLVEIKRSRAEKEQSI